MAKSRLRVVRIERQCALEGVGSFLDPVEAKEASAETEQRVHLELAAVQPMRFRELPFAVELLERLANIVLRKPDEGEKPVETQRGISIAAGDLAILDGGALPKNGFCLQQMPSRDVNHR